MIIRVEHRKHYTVITDQALRDPALSFRATGLLAYLLSLPDGTEISGLRIQHAKREGRDAVFSALKELETSGYLQRQRLKDSTGRWFWANVLVELRPGNPQPFPGFQETVNQETETQESSSLVPKDEVPIANASLETLETGEPTRMPDELRRRLPRRESDDEEQEQTA